jgi:hypothetical protein
MLMKSVKCKIYFMKQVKMKNVSYIFNLYRPCILLFHKHLSVNQVAKFRFCSTNLSYNISASSIEGLNPLF